MTRNKMRSYTRLKVNAKILPYLHEQRVRRRRLAVHVHPGGTKPCDFAVTINVQGISLERADRPGA